MDKFETMRGFVETVGSGSYAAAARKLGLTRSALSKAVAGLEDELGVRLLHRTTRRIAPTEAGLAYAERAQAIMSLVTETEAAVTALHENPRGLLRVNAPLSFGISQLAPAVAEFMTLHPDLRIELTLNDRFIDPLEEGVDVTVRITEPADSSLIARRFSSARRVIVASPDYLERRGAPANADGLATHDILYYGHAGTTHRWTLTNGKGARVAVPVTPRMCANNGEVLREACLKGQGIAMLPTFIVGDDVRAGRLVRLLEKASPPDLDILALYAPSKLLAAKSRLFIDFLVSRFRGRPSWDVA
jgi:DNA-binding transcriptional LysR family regulator